MDRQQAKELLPIIQAFAEGKNIEYRSKGFNEDWKKVTQIPGLSFNSFEYRIKPEPKYRPFVNTKECWTEMQKHQPFGWLRVIRENARTIVNYIHNKGVIFSNGSVSFERMFDNYTFADGTPFGVKAEE